MEFEIRTDNRPLVDIFTAKGIEKVSPRISRWVLRMLKFVYKMVYVPGKKNVLADCLSGLPCESSEQNDATSVG